MKEGREKLVSGKPEPQDSGVNHLPPEELFSTGWFCLPADIWQCLKIFLLVRARRQVLLTSSG